MGQFFAGVSLGNWLTIFLIAVSVVSSWHSFGARIDHLEYRIVQLEVRLTALEEQERADFASIEAVLQELLIQNARYQTMLQPGGVIPGN